MTEKLGGQLKPARAEAELFRTSEATWECEARQRPLRTWTRGSIMYYPKTADRQQGGYCTCYLQEKRVRSRGGCVE